MLRSALLASGVSDEVLERICGDSREWVERLTNAGAFIQPKPNDALTFEDQRRAIRQALGDAFLSWLIVAVRLTGRFISIAPKSVTQLDAVEEYKTLREEAGEKGLPRLRDLGILTLAYELEQRGAAATFAHVLSWIGVDKAEVLSEKARAAVSDLWTRHEFQWSADPPRSSEEPEADAQSLRRAGYFALLDGNETAAVDFYDRALHASAREGEPSSIRLLTATSLDALLVNSHSFRGGVADAASRHTDLQPELRTLYEDSAATSLLLESAELAHEEERRKQAEKSVSELEADAPDSTIFRTYSEPLEPSLEFLERHWMCPWRCAAVAERIAAVRWRNGEWASSAAMFARYGSDELSQRAAALLRGPRRVGIDRGLLEELLRPARWKHELRARLAALAELASETPAEKATELLALARSAIADLQKNPSLMGTHHSWPHQPAVKLGTALGYYLPWEKFYAWFVEANQTSEGGLWSVAGVDWHSLPISQWLESADVGAEDLDAVFRCLLQAASAPYTGLSEEWVFDSMVTAFERTNSQAILKASSAVDAMRKWTGSGEPHDDNDEWLRSEASHFFAAADGRDTTAYRRDRAAVQQVLIKRAFDAGGSPDPSLVNAWLTNAGALEGDGREIAWRVVRASATLAAVTPEDFAEHRRRTHADRAITRALARLTPTGAESPEWTELAVRACDRSPEVTGEIAWAWSTIPTGAQAFLSRRVADGLAGVGPHQERARPRYISLDCVERASRHSAPSDIPRPWLFGAAQLTTSASPAVAARACRVVAEVTGQCHWTEQDGDVLNAFRDSLLRATSEGRADVVAAGLRGLLDVRCSTNDNVRATIAEHSATTATLERLAADDRLAVVSVREGWVRRARAVRPRSRGE